MINDRETINFLKKLKQDVIEEHEAKSTLARNQGSEVNVCALAGDMAGDLWSMQQQIRNILNKLETYTHKQAMLTRRQTGMSAEVNRMMGRKGQVY